MTFYVYVFFFFFFDLINILAVVFLYFFASFFFYFILILFNLLAEAVFQYDPNQITENHKQHILMGNGVKYCLCLFVSLFLSVFLSLHLNFRPGHRRCTLYTTGCRMKAYKKPISITVWFFNLHTV